MNLYQCKLSKIIITKKIKTKFYVRFHQTYRNSGLVTTHLLHVVLSFSLTVQQLRRLEVHVEVILKRGLKTLLHAWNCFFQKFRCLTNLLETLIKF